MSAIGVKTIYSLGMIKELEMLHPFSGKKIKITRTNSLDAIARSVCADKTLIECDKIVKMANYVYKKQMRKIIDNCNRIINRNWLYNTKLKILVTGHGAKLIKNALHSEKIGEIIDDMAVFENSENATAIALSMLLAEKYNN